MADTPIKTRTVWVGRHEEEYQLPEAAQLIWVQEYDDQPYYELSFTEGPFSGYPSMKLTAYSLAFFNETITKELSAYNEKTKAEAEKKLKEMVTCPVCEKPLTTNPFFSEMTCYDHGYYAVGLDTTGHIVVWVLGE